MTGEDGRLPEHVQRAVTGILHGVVPDGMGGGDGLSKDDALALAGDLAEWVKSLVTTGPGWCPVHGVALCPEQYMLMRNGKAAPGYAAVWDEGVRCGKRQPTWREPRQFGRDARAVDPTGGEP